MVTDFQPGYLYQFTADFGSLGIFYWRYTSNADAIVSSAVTFNPWQIDHGSIRNSIVMDQDETSIQVAFESTGLWAMIKAGRPQRRLRCEIWEIDRSIPDVRTLLLSGWVRKPSLKGRQLSFGVSSWIDAMESEVPWGTCQHRCNYRFGDPDNCKFDLSTRTMTMEPPYWGIADEPRRIKLLWTPSTPPPPAWLVDGALVGGQFKLPATAAADGTPVIRDIIAQEGLVVSFTSWVLITIAAPLPALAGGSQAFVSAGCDRVVTTCQSYGNLVNFGGFAGIPKRNIAVKAWDADQTQGKGK